MEVDYHFVQDRVAANTFKISYYSSKDQIVDVFTKALVSDKFILFCTSINVVNTSLDSMGHISIEPSIPK